MPNNQISNKSQVYWLVLTAIFMSITLVLKLIFYFIPIINGYGLELQIIGYVYGLMLIKDTKGKGTFWFLTPGLLLIIPPTIVNLGDLLIEYILALYIFIPFIFLDSGMKHIKNENKPKQSFTIEILCFSLLMIILVFLKLFLHALAGVGGWMPGEWGASFIFNLPIYGVTLAVVLPISIIIYKPMQQIKI